MGLAPLAPASLAFYALAATVVLRARHAFLTPSARFTWLASVAGALALLAYGTLVPLHFLDGALGGTNLISLVQNVLTTLAFWLVFQAVNARGAASGAGLRVAPLVIGVFSFSAPFFWVDRGATSPDFLLQNVTQPPLLASMTLYLVTVIIICAGICVKLCAARSRGFSLLIVGTITMAIASCLEIFALVTKSFDWLQANTQAALFSAVVPTVGVGVVLFAANISWLTLRRLLGERKEAKLFTGMRVVSNQNMHHSGSSASAFWRASSQKGSSVTDLYPHVIAANDRAFLAQEPLNEADHASLDAASSIIQKRLTNTDARPYPRLFRKIIDYAVR